MDSLFLKLYQRAVTLIIINNFQIFGNEKHLKCEKNIILLEKYKICKNHFNHIIDTPKERAETQTLT